MRFCNNNATDKGKKLVYTAHDFFIHLFALSFSPLPRSEERANHPLTSGVVGVGNRRCTLAAMSLY
jgi:hypothetical protein